MKKHRSFPALRGRQWRYRNRRWESFTILNKKLRKDGIFPGPDILALFTLTIRIYNIIDEIRLRVASWPILCLYRSCFS